MDLVIRKSMHFYIILLSALVCGSSVASELKLFNRFDQQMITVVNNTMSEFAKKNIDDISFDVKIDANRSGESKSSNSSKVQQNPVL